MIEFISEKIMTIGSIACLAVKGELRGVLRTISFIVIKNEYSKRGNSLWNDIVKIIHKMQSGNESNENDSLNILVNDEK